MTTDVHQSELSYERNDSEREREKKKRNHFSSFVVLVMKQVDSSTGYYESNACHINIEIPFFLFYSP